MVFVATYMNFFGRNVAFEIITYFPSVVIPSVNLYDTDMHGRCVRSLDRFDVSSKCSGQSRLDRISSNNRIYKEIRLAPL
jgi:hypothetical protein